MLDEATNVEPIDQTLIPVDALLGNGDSAHLGDTVHHLEIAEHGRGVDQGLWSEFADDPTMNRLERFGTHEHRIDEPEQ